MTTNKERIEKLKKDLGSAYSDINTLRQTNEQLKTKNDEIIEELKKSNEALEKVNELINNKKDEDGELSPLLDETEEAMKKLQDEINELKEINKKLVEQNEELKKQSSGVLMKSLAILGVFAGGAWLVAGIADIITRLRRPSSSE